MTVIPLLKLSLVAAKDANLVASSFVLSMNRPPQRYGKDFLTRTSVEFTTSTSKAFWSTPDPAAPKINHASIEVTYVDDEAVAVTASSPAKLAKALSIIVQSYSEVFAAFGLEINWKKVKVRP